MNPTFAYSLDGETFEGCYPSRAEALEAGTKELAAQVGDDGGTVTTCARGARKLSDYATFDGLIERALDQASDEVGGETCDPWGDTLQACEDSGPGRRAIARAVEGCRAVIDQLADEQDLNPKFFAADDVEEHPIAPNPKASDAD